MYQNLLFRIEFMASPHQGVSILADRVPLSSRRGEHKFSVSTLVDGVRLKFNTIGKLKLNKAGLALGLFTFLLQAISSLDSFAQQTMVIQDEIDQYIFAFQTIEYLEDASDKLTVNQVASSQYASRFKKNTTFNPTNINKKSAYWYRIKIKHNSNSQRKWVIEFFDQTIDHLEFYVPDLSGKYDRILMGDEFVFSQRETKHKNFITNLPSRGDEELTYYIKVKSKQRADVLIVLRTQSWLFQYALDEYFFFGIFYGMILVFSFYNLLMFIAVRERQYLYYILYLISVGIYEMSADGIGFQYLWPQWPSFNYYASGLSLYLASTAALVFSSSLLNLRKQYVKLFRLFVFVFLFRTIFLVVSITLVPEWFGFRFIEILLFSAIYFASIHSYFIEKYPPARFLVAAYSFLAFGVIYKVLQYFNIEWSPLGDLSHYSLGFSFIIEMLLLSFAISDKIRVLRLEKEEAQANTIEQLHENQKLKDNLNKTLEEQVQLKTAELLQKSVFIEEQNHQLEMANEQLAAQAKEILKKNILLSSDNVKLQHDVAEVKEARVLSKEVDFEEFSAMHPDDDSWMKFLAEVKWHDGYSCRKCRNTSFSPGRSPHSRRCTRCGYDESVTAYTLLQNTRLPLNKALYMVFLVYNSQGNISSHKLSEVLGIRQSTCWAYSSRIKNILKEMRKKGHKHTQTGWSSIILEEH